MRIENYVSQLLYRYQCVIIPGFGAFLTEIKSARLVEGANTFYPPYKAISFNSHVKNNDGLLANAVSIFEKVSFEQASKIIEISIIEWQNEIENTGKLSLEDIGFFLKNSEGNLVFEPYLYTNYLTESFGLSPYVSPKVKREIQETILQTVTVNEAVIIEKEPVKLFPEVSFSLPKIELGTGSFAKYAAVLVVGLAISVGLVKMHNENVDKQTVLMEKAVQEKIQNTIQQATFNLDIPQYPLPLPIKVSKAPFHVVASAFRDLENAEYEAKILNLGGFNARVLPVNEHGLHTVIYSSFSNAEEARVFLARIKKSYNSNAWLLTKDL